MAEPLWLTYSLTGGFGAALTWVTMRLNGALVWRTNAEGYKAELERVESEYSAMVSTMRAKIEVLERQVGEQGKLIQSLQARTDVTPIYDMVRDIQAVVHGRTELIRSIVQSETERKAENAKLFSELQAHVFPAIEEIHRSVVPPPTS